MSRPTEAEYARIEEAHKLLDQIESLQAENAELMCLGHEAANDCAKKDKELADLRAENAEKDKEIERLTFMLDSAKNVAIQRGRKLDSVTAKRDAAMGEIERLKSIMREDGIMVIPSKYPGGRPALNIRRGAQGEA